MKTDIFLSAMNRLDESFINEYAGTTPRRRRILRYVAVVAAILFTVAALTAVAVLIARRQVPGVPDDTEAGSGTIPSGDISSVAQAYEVTGFWLSSDGCAVLCLYSDFSYEHIEMGNAESGGETGRYELSNSMLLLSASSGEEKVYTVEEDRLVPDSGERAVFTSRSDVFPVGFAASVISGLWADSGETASGEPKEFAIYFSGSGIAQILRPNEVFLTNATYSFDGRTIVVDDGVSEYSFRITGGMSIMQTEPVTRPLSRIEGRASPGIQTDFGAVLAVTSRIASFSNGGGTAFADREGLFENAVEISVSTPPDVSAFSMRGVLSCSLYTTGGEVMYENAAEPVFPGEGDYFLILDVRNNVGNFSYDVEYCFKVRYYSQITEPVYEDFTYHSSLTSVVITGYKGTETEIAIPEKINGVKVSGIGAGAFEYSDIVSVTIPESVREIGAGAFANCTLLERVNSELSGTAEIPSGVRSLGSYAFAGCTSLTSLTGGSPSLVTYVSAFSWCTSLKNIDLTAKVLQNDSFSGCTALESVSLHGTETIAYAFECCPVLRKIELGSGLKGLMLGDLPALEELVIHSSKEEFESAGVFVPEKIRRMILERYGFDCYGGSGPADQSFAVWTSSDGSIIFWTGRLETGGMTVFVEEYGTVFRDAGLIRQGETEIPVYFSWDSEGRVGVYALDKLSPEDLMQSPMERRKADDPVFSGRFYVMKNRVFFVPEKQGGKTAPEYTEILYALPDRIEFFRDRKDTGWEILCNRLIREDNKIFAESTDGKRVEYPRQEGCFFGITSAGGESNCSAVFVETGNRKPLLVIFDFEIGEFIETGALSELLTGIVGGTAYASCIQKEGEDYIILVCQHSLSMLRRDYYVCTLRQDGSVTARLISSEEKADSQSGPELFYGTDGRLFLKLKDGNLVYDTSLRDWIP